MPLTILTDGDVRSLLLSLDRNDVLEMQQSLADALHYYSTSFEESGNACCSSYQPMRTKLKRRDGLTTLFMPASSNDGIGVKIVTLSEPGKDTSTSSSSTSSSSTPSSKDPTSTELSPMSSLSLSSPSSGTSSPRSSTPFEAPPSIASSQSTTPRGLLTLLDKHGIPRALINAEEITAFRTALASTMLLKKRANVHDVCVFGAGKQAYWHIRLALLLRGPEVHHVNIINRTFATASALMRRLFDELPAMRAVKISILTPAHQEYARLLKATVRQAAVIFCTTPALAPLFPAAHLTSIEGRRKGRYIAAIGSYAPHMIELHPDVVRAAVAPSHGAGHHHRHARTSGAIVVDSVEACLKEAGEVIQAGLTGHEVVEIGELVMLKRDAEARRRAAAAAAAAADGNGMRSSVSSLDESGVEIWDSRAPPLPKDGTEDLAAKGLREWLERGNVIYKSVGLGLMDVVVGTDLVRLADERGLGTRIDNF